MRICKNHSWVKIRDSREWSRAGRRKENKDKGMSGKPMSEMNQKILSFIF
jgi:hypothetical protein